MPEQEKGSDSAGTESAGTEPEGAGPFGRHSAAGLEDVALLAVGLADAALERLRRAADRGRQLLRRSDLRELVADGVHDLRARGELASRRVTPDTENYLEVMACRAVKRAQAAEVSGPAHA
ncbi:polyprenyl synthetase [Streptomyces sp. Ac-502]|uniref:polyprenyl synthetase n=1 Tax=Streptomyces sp. Ac-502 TaxID=3342801 RepID=UPI0038624981